MKKGKENKNYIIITGSNFLNKGSQSMLFSTVHMLKELYPSKEIVMLSTKDYLDPKLDKQQFTFQIHPDYLSRFITPSLRLMRKVFMKLTGERGTKEEKEQMLELKKILQYTCMIVDISGFALSCVWKSQVVSINYILRIAAAKYWKIPIYLLPQSFGPFEYRFPYNIINNLLNRYYLRYPQVICAREQDGVNSLKKYHLKNVYRVNDTVITTTNIKLHNIYKKVPVIGEIKVVGEHPIAIIPNMRSLQRGNTDQLLKLYQQLIHILCPQHDIYLIRHSKEDLEGCEMIGKLCGDNKRVHILAQDMTCLEFETLVKKFDFCIASRFHSIVHAYKNGIPCISLGWAVKYKELMELMGQERFLYDVRKTIDRDKLYEEIHYMEINYKMEGTTILKKMDVLRENNGFQFLTAGILSQAK